MFIIIQIRNSPFIKQEIIRGRNQIGTKNGNYLFKGQIEAESGIQAVNTTKATLPIKYIYKKI